MCIIDSLKDKSEVYPMIAEMHKKGIHPYFIVYVSADDMNSSMNMVQTLSLIHISVVW